MRRMYYDYEQFCQKDGPDVFFVRDMEVVSAGTEIYSMPVNDKVDEYDRVSKETGIHYNESGSLL